MPGAWAGVRVRRVGGVPGARLLGLVVLVYALLRLPAASDTAPGAVSFLQFNMCGNACGRGSRSSTTWRRRSRSHGRPPFVLTLNEVCRGQYDQLLATCTTPATSSRRCGTGAGTAATTASRSWSAPARSASGSARAARPGRRRTPDAGLRPDDGPLPAADRLRDPPGHRSGEHRRARSPRPRPGPPARSADAVVVVGGDFNADPGQAADPPDGRRLRGGRVRPRRRVHRRLLAGPLRRPARATRTRPARSTTSSSPAATSPTSPPWCPRAPHSDHTPLWSTATLAPAR